MFGSGFFSNLISNILVAFIRVETKKIPAKIRIVRLKRWGLGVGGWRLGVGGWGGGLVVMRGKLEEMRGGLRVMRGKLEEMRGGLGVIRGFQGGGVARILGWG